MECSKDKNCKKCNCTYKPCNRKGICCECVEYHRRANQLPACYFDEKTEKSYDRSIENFIKMWQTRK
jgi:hypothetical protein